MCRLFWICWIIVWLRDSDFFWRGFIQEVEIGPLSGQWTFAVTAYYEVIYFLHYDILFKLLLIFPSRDVTTCGSNT